MAITISTSQDAPVALAKCAQHKLVNESSRNQQQQQRNHQRPSKRVTFDETQNMAYDNTTWTAEDCKRTWCSRVDYDQMKENTYTLAKQIWRREKHLHSIVTYTNVVLGVYDACCHASATNTAVPSQEPSNHDDDESSTYSDSSSVSSSSTTTSINQELLTQIVGKANSRSGLEKICIREIAHDKRFRRVQVLDGILTLQAAAASAGSSSSRNAELMRLASETISLPSRLFASHMAMALATSLLQE